MIKVVASRLFCREGPSKTVCVYVCGTDMFPQFLKALRITLSALQRSASARKGINHNAMCELRWRQTDLLQKPLQYSDCDVLFAYEQVILSERSH